MSDVPSVRRGDVVITALPDPLGNEIGKRRPFVVVSPDEMNVDETTYFIAPLTTGHHPYHFRVPCKFAGRKGHVVLDQMVAADAQRVGRAVGKLPANTVLQMLARLREVFAE